MPGQSYPTAHSVFMFIFLTAMMRRGQKEYLHNRLSVHASRQHFESDASSEGKNTWFLIFVFRKAWGLWGGIDILTLTIILELAAVLKDGLWKTVLKDGLWKTVLKDHKIISSLLHVYSFSTPFCVGFVFIHHFSELKARQSQGLISDDTLLLTVADPASRVGSGGATLNALLVATEHLSSKAGYTVSPL